ncbi:hypothetical protein AB0J21_04675 [Streptomyces sp. NPDC049954]|uniref:hypothetical protein n=1 Tax=Streptomyces sp. NPDC049954 TaxID=3155779 RepID=UPI003445D1D7
MSTVIFPTPSVTVSAVVGAVPRRLSPARTLRALRAVRAVAEAAFEVVVLGEYEGYAEQAGIRRRHRHVNEGRERPGEHRT